MGWLAEPAVTAGVARLNPCPVKKACSPTELQDSSQELAPFLEASPSWQELPHQAEFNPAVCLKQGEVLRAAVHPLGRPVAVPLRPTQ